MFKYSVLKSYLLQQSSSHDALSLSFEDIERLIGSALPPSARTYREWWGNDFSHVQARAWLDAGWEATVDVANQDRVIFRRKL